MAIDFSSIGATPAQTGRVDFSSIGGIPAVGQDETADETTALGAAGRGAVGMIPLGAQAYSAIAGAIENKPYLQERQELEKEIAADIASHPMARLGGQAAGIVAPALLTGGASLPGGALAEGALMGAGFGAGSAIDTLASGGSGAKAAGNVALGTVAGIAGGTVGKGLGNVIGKVAKPFVNSQDEILAEATAGILGGTTRQIRSLPGKNPVQTLVKLGEDMNRYTVNGEPLIAMADQMPARLNKFLALQEQAGKTIGDTIRSSNIAPMPIKPITEELTGALKFATPDDQAQMQAVVDQVQRYAEKGDTISFGRLQQLKGELGDRAFHGQGNPVLQSAYHVVSDVQDRELAKISSAINKPGFDDAKNAYRLTSMAIPLLRMSVSKEVGGKTNLLIPGAALLSGHPVVAAGALMKSRLGQIGSGAMFKGIQALPENVGTLAGELPGKIGGQVAGAAMQQNMGETKPVHPTSPVTSPVGGTPTIIDIEHPAIAPWKPIFQKNAAKAKDAGEVQKANAVTDFILSQRDPSYAAAKQRMADEPMAVESANNPAKMAEGGVVPSKEHKFGEPVEGFGSTLPGLAEQLRHPTHEAPPTPKDTLPTRTTQRFHQPFNTDMEDKLRAFLSARKDKGDAKLR